MKRISNQLREDAIEACLLLAEESLVRGRHDSWPYDHAGVSALFCYEEESEVANLAVTAWSAVPTGYVHETYLEAAALLRDGWSPGDPVRRLGLNTEGG